MNSCFRHASASIAVSLILTLGGPVSAQINPELGDVDEPPPADNYGQQDSYGAQTQGSYGAQTQGSYGAQAQQAPAGGGTWQPPTGQVSQAGPPPEFADEDAGGEVNDGDSDHARVVGKFGIGFFGTQSVPVMGCLVPCIGAGTVDQTVSDLTVLAPTLGIRYWLSEGMAIEVALGFHHSSDSHEFDVEGSVPNPTGGTTMTFVAPELTVTAFALHAGVPLALAHSGHFTFEVVPEVNFGIATGSYEDTNDDLKWSTSGLLIEAGARAGAEIHFGFIDIPQLSLQASIGLFLRHEGRSAERAGDTTLGAGFEPTTVSDSHTEVRTTLEGEPWDIFTGSITAIYYL